MADHAIGIRPGPPERHNGKEVSTWQGFCSCGWAGTAYKGDRGGKKLAEAKAGATADALRHQREA